jgi:hypothetical protein
MVHSKFEMLDADRLGQVQPELRVERGEQHLALAFDVLEAAALGLQAFDLVPESPVLGLQRADVPEAAEERPDRPEDPGDGDLHRRDDRRGGATHRFEDAGVPLPVVDGDDDEARHDEGDDQQARAPVRATGDGHGRSP